MAEKIAIIGLGYVGLPVALAFARKHPGTVGFDIHDEKVKELQRGFDRNREVPEEELKSSTLTMTSNPKKGSRTATVLIQSGRAHMKTEMPAHIAQPMCRLGMAAYWLEWAAISGWASDPHVWNSITVSM